MEDIDAYLKMTGQTIQYLMSGASQYGIDFIQKLATKALKQNKKIVWETKLIDGEDIGLYQYRFASL